MKLGSLTQTQRAELEAEPGALEEVFGPQPELETLEAFLFGFYRQQLRPWAPLGERISPSLVFTLWDRLVGWRWVDDAFLLAVIRVLDEPRVEREMESAASLRALSGLLK